MTKKPDTRRWFEKVTPCKNLNAEREVKFVPMEEFNTAWKKKPMAIPIEEEDDKKCDSRKLRHTKILMADEKLSTFPWKFQ